MRQVLCTACHPYSGHLFERLGNGLTMTAQFCEEYYSECSDQLNLPPDYCSTHVGEPDEVWAYPLVIDGEDPREHGGWRRLPCAISY